MSKSYDSLQGAALAKAKVMSPSLTEQYQIFKLELGEMQRMAHENSDNTMDMASYAAFQRQFKGLREAHKAVLFAFRAFWQSLVKHDVSYVHSCQPLQKGGKTSASGKLHVIPSVWPNTQICLLVLTSSESSV